MSAETAEELQQQEIIALKAIYDERFLESPPPKAWKGAARQPEFILKLCHPDPHLASRAHLHLLVKFPKTYPQKAVPTFAVQQYVGITPQQAKSLEAEIRSEAQRQHGQEMVFHIANMCEEWIERNVKIVVDTPGGSLASLMEKRSLEAEKAKQQEAEAQAEQKNEEAMQLVSEWNEQVKENQLRKEELQRAERERNKARRRAMSDVTERPSGDGTVEDFDGEIEYQGVRFNSVRLYHPRRDGLGMTYSAVPVFDDDVQTISTFELDVHVVTFASSYYATNNQGRKKLHQLQEELKRLSFIRHENLLRIFAVNLTFPQSSGSPRLSILAEQPPAMTLQDILQNCDTLREHRAADYLGQILSALHAVHSADLIHKAISTTCIGVSTQHVMRRSNLVKITKVAYYTKLQELQRSVPFCMDPQENSESVLADGWLPWDAIDSPLLYTRNRDIHSVAVVTLQMLMGLDVVNRYPEARLALRSSTISTQMQRMITVMLSASKKNPTSCLTLLGILAESTFLTIPSSPAVIEASDSKTPRALGHVKSPVADYFTNDRSRTRQASRWREDWEELELLGRGGFGSVVKARNKLDNRIYAVKKIKLLPTQKDNKIFREVNALSRLSHRFIVRYYTTWLETIEARSGHASSGSDSDNSDDSDGARTSIVGSARGVDDTFDPFSIDLDDIGSGGQSSSFPSIHFSTTGNSGVDGDDDDDDSDDDDGLVHLFEQNRISSGTSTPINGVQRTLYIQMEFVERQTLKERIAEGISEEESWRLFQQIVDALVHMSSLGILHRDIKLKNIFIDGNGDCKIGDFGLAVSSIAAVDPTDISPARSMLTESDMTLEVGTRLYVAPEVLTPRGSLRNHMKADMYSLGIVFFEMNFKFNTESERIHVIEEMRKPEIIFPETWDTRRSRQKQIITWLLQHDPAERPSAVELSRSPLLPSRLEDEYFKGALEMMAKPDSPHYQSVLSSLFNQQARPVRGFLYDDDVSEQASLLSIVTTRLTEIFRLHGAVDMETPLLMPNMKVGPEDPRQIYLLDKHGEIVMLSANAMIPFARLAARKQLKRIKRFNVGNTYRDNGIGGHPRVLKVATFDIITPDLSRGPEAAFAEMIEVANEILDAFPGLQQNYNIYVSHSRIYRVVLDRVPEQLRSSVLDILSQPKSTISQKKSQLTKKGLQRSTIEEYEALAEIYDDINSLMLKLEKSFPQLWVLISDAFNEIKKVAELVASIGGTPQIYFRPLLVGRHVEGFREGVCFEISKITKRTDILAAGGRYDHLISQFSPPTPRADRVCAVGLQLSVDRITASLATFQTSLTSVLKAQRSFGFWAARRCDVYVVSLKAGFLQERLEIASLLWKHGISADVMYERDSEGMVAAESDLESLAEMCAKEGILFTIYPRTRASLQTFKVKSVLKGTEYEVSRQDIIGWLQQQIAEQKRSDLTTSGVHTITDSTQGLPMQKEGSNSTDIQLLLPGDTKKQRKQTKQIFRDRAYSKSAHLKSSIQSGHVPLFAIDVPSGVFDLLSRNDQYLTEDETWRNIASSFPAQTPGYANQIREALAKKKAEGCAYVLLFHVREERVALLGFSGG